MDKQRDEAGLFLPHEPTDKTRAEVSALSSFGNTQEEIALYLDIHPETLRKHYRKELDTAVIRANAQVARGLYNKAVSQDDLSAQIFWLKTRGRWRTQDVETLNNENEKMKEELSELRQELEKKNKKSY